MELTSCNKCQFVDEVNDVENKFMDPYYAHELLKAAKDLPVAQQKEGLVAILEQLTKNECKSRVGYREQKTCENCQIPLRVEQRWLLELPEVYSLGL